jgi:hypothetical protein
MAQLLRYGVLKSLADRLFAFQLIRECCPTGGRFVFLVFADPSGLSFGRFLG